MSLRLRRDGKSQVMDELSLVRNTRKKEFKNTALDQVIRLKVSDLMALWPYSSARHPLFTSIAASTS
jgi:hypothetical protein